MSWKARICGLNACCFLLACEDPGREDPLHYQVSQLSGTKAKEAEGTHGDRR